MIGKIWHSFRHSSFGEKARSFLPNWLINFFWHLPKAVLANVYYRFPSRKLFVIGVTGTDGKTTTASLIHEILLQADKKTALISTLSPMGFHVTSPDPFVLQGFLREIVNQRIKYLVLESTSHGLDQHRLWGVRFKVGVVTNVTSEHLDYHKTYENYLAAKGKLFKKVQFAILNKDDQSFSYLDSVRPKGSKLVAYAIREKADFTPQTFRFKSLLLGKYNQYNCLAAIATSKALGISDGKIRKTIALFQGVVGRVEEIDLGQNFKVFVDFAHTPNALEQVLVALKKQKEKKRLIVVFGCAGLRDKRKRPQMGKIACCLADRVVLTAEDPRTEDVNEIIDQIAEGCLETKAKEISLDHYDDAKRSWFIRIPDRAEAIKFAIQKLAQKGDLVAICGKGHEKSICYGKTEYPWSDHQEIRKALKERLNSTAARRNPPTGG